MALFKENKKEEKGKKELSKIVLDMLVENEPEEEIIETLENTGLSNEDSQKVLKKIKKDYYEFLSQKLDEKVEEMFEENAEEMLEDFNKRIKDRLEETQLKIDLRFTEMKESIEDEIWEVEKKTNMNRELNKDLKQKTIRGYNQLKKDIKSIEFSGPLQGVLSSSLMIIGALVIAYALSAIPDLPELLKNPLSVTLLPLTIVILAIVAGLILFVFGFNVLRRMRRAKIDAFEEQ